MNRRRSRSKAKRLARCRSASESNAADARIASGPTSSRNTTISYGSAGTNNAFSAITCGFAPGSGSVNVTSVIGAATRIVPQLRSGRTQLFQTRNWHHCRASARATPAPHFTRGPDLACWFAKADADTPVGHAATPLFHLVAVLDEVAHLPVGSCAEALPPLVTAAMQKALRVGERPIHNARYAAAPRTATDQREPMRRRTISTVCRSTMRSKV